MQQSIDVCHASKPGQLGLKLKHNPELFLDDECDTRDGKKTHEQASNACIKLFIVWVKSVTNSMLLNYKICFVVFKPSK